jgi:phage/plasmid-like protein (TIGR03299 family)
MAHNINYNQQTSKHSFFSVKEKAWHGLGQIVSDYPTSAEALKYAGLDYQVEKRPLFTYDNENFKGNEETDIIIPEIEVPNFYATMRTDTEDVLGVVGREYQVVQNTDAFSFFDSIVGGGNGILYETAGALGKGERIFITAKLPDYIRVGLDDMIEKYLFLTTSHDGSGSIIAAFTPIRIVCNNTLNCALNNMSNCIKIRHTESAQEKLKQAHTLMGITNKLAVELSEIYNRWSRIRVTDVQVLKLVQQAMAPSKEILQAVLEGKEHDHSTHFKNVCNSVCEYAFSHESQQSATTKGTLFGAYNAITGYFQNVKSYKDQESKLKSIQFGSGLSKAQTAFKLCAQYQKNQYLFN